MVGVMIVKHAKPKPRKPSAWDSQRIMHGAVTNASNQPSRCDVLLRDRTARVVGVGELAPSEVDFYIDDTGHVLAYSRG